MVIFISVNSGSLIAKIIDELIIYLNPVLFNAAIT